MEQQSISFPEPTQFRSPFNFYGDQVLATVDSTRRGLVVTLNLPHLPAVTVSEDNRGSAHVAEVSIPGPGARSSLAASVYGSLIKVEANIALRIDTVPLTLDRRGRLYLSDDIDAWYKA